MKGETDDPIRVLLLVHGLGLGGAERTLYNIAEPLKRYGCLPVVCAWRCSGPLEERFRVAGVQLEIPSPAPAWRTRLRTATRLRQIVRRYRIDLVHAHLSDSGFWGIVLQRLTGLPCVITHHSTDLIDGIERHRWFRRRLLLACLRRAAVNVAVSPAVANRLAAASGMPADRIVLLPSATTLPPDTAVESSCAARNVRAATGFKTEGAPTIVYVGRIAPLKGVETLVAAAPEVVRTFQNASFIFVGAGVLLEDLRRRVQALGLAAHFRFIGGVKDVSAFLSSADLYVSASRLEGLSLAVIEAMSWGVPVVASDIDGHRELVRSGESGTLVPPDDPALLGAAIVNALQDWRATEAGAHRAREVVRARHDSTDLARRHFELYRRILCEGGR